jgi:peptidylprolyl isomerase
MRSIVAFLPLILALLTQKQQQHTCVVAFDLEIKAAPSSVITRRSTLVLAPLSIPPILSLFPNPAFSASRSTPDLQFSTSRSGLQWADARIGNGQTLKPGSPVAIDYVMSTTGARYGSKICSSIDSSAPYRWVLGDGSTISGLELAIVGDETIPPMQPGGIRRLIIPPSLGYETLAKPIPGMEYQDYQEGKGVGPIPPVGEGTAGEYYQRFKNIYCNANRLYQPDLVMDIKLYGKRTP